MSLSVTPLYSATQTSENLFPPSSSNNSSAAQASAASSQAKPTLSEQIKQLEDQGQSAKEIAASLGTTVAIVDSYLDVTTEEEATTGTTIQLTA